MANSQEPKQSSDARKKSPRAPSIALDEAVDRALRIYEKERRHAAPADIIAQDIGYKNANNGAALSAIASLRYYGLLDRAPDGKLAITKQVEEYRFVPSESAKQTILLSWLKSPSIFSYLLDKFSDGLPSDAVLRFELIQNGFSPSSAETVLSAFKKSVEFVRPFRAVLEEPPLQSEALPHMQAEEAEPAVSRAQPVTHEVNSAVDRIPVRLTRGRRAWIEIPTPFFEADKDRLKAQIDLLLTDEAESSE